MKKLIFIILSVFYSVCISAQVFNRGKIVERGIIVAGMEPTYHINGGGNGLMMFFHGGYGLESGLDLAIKLGTGNEAYSGVELEWALGERISLLTGVHNFVNIGLDAGITFSVPVNRDTRVFSGVDADMIFGDKLQLPVWIPLGVEIRVRHNTSFLLETEIGVISDAYHVIAGGVVFYL